MKSLTFKPTKDEEQQIEALAAESSALMAKAKEIAVVTDAESEVRAVEFLKQIKLRINVVDGIRTKLVKPLNDHVKMINAEFKLTTGPLEEADALVRRGMTTYRNGEEFKAAEARRKAAEAEMQQATRAGDVEKVGALSSGHAEATAAAPRTVETQSGQGRFRKVWRWEIEDIEALPAGFWIPDQVKIEAAVKAGITVPGIKAYQEEVPVIV